MSVDFNITSYDTSQAKNLDTARYILITVTENGLPRAISGTENPRLRLHKPDNTYVYNTCEVVEDGRILVTLTEQILAYPGTATCDIQIVRDSDKAIYSTKVFHIVIDIPAYDNKVIESSNEFGALNNLIAEEQERINAIRELDKQITNNENIRKTNEEARIVNEIDRQGSETIREQQEVARQNAETQRSSDENSRIANEKNRQTNESARQLQEMTRQTNTNAAISDIQDATNECVELIDNIRQSYVISGITEEPSQNEGSFWLIDL